MVETLLAAGKRETAIDMIVPNTQQQPQPQAASGMSESSDTTAPIATIEGHDDTDLKIDGGDVTKNVVTSPPSCTRLDEASQACV